MKQKLFTISFIVATLGRREDLHKLLRSLADQDPHNINFEVIIVDQNVNSLIDSVIDNFKEVLTIKHHKVSFQSTSKARNLGITLSNGNYIAFPDDDCTYYPTFLSTLEKKIISTDYPEIILARIFDKKTNRSLIKNFPDYDCSVSARNFYSYGSAIVIITKNKTILFDENFGPGSKYHSNEDPEYLLRLLLSSKNKARYFSNLHVHHLEHSNNLVPIERIQKYSFGAGALFRKHATIRNILTFIAILILHFGRFSLSAIKHDSTYKNHWAALSFRIKGFIKYIND